MQVRANALRVSPHAHAAVLLPPQLLGASRAQLFFAVSGAGSSTTLVLILTELTGFYALSTVLLLRKQLPPKYRRARAVARRPWLCSLTELEPCRALSRSVKERSASTCCAMHVCC